MKRLMAGAITIILLLSLCACGDKKDDNKTDNNQTATTTAEATTTAAATTAATAQEAEIGATVSYPEKTFDVNNTSKLYVRWHTGSGEDIKEFEYALEDVTDDLYLLYATDGLLKLNECVYEVNGDDIKKYAKTCFDEKFSPATKSDDLRKEVDDHFSLLNFLISGIGELEDVEYKKQKDFNAVGTGPAYVYDVYEKGENQGSVMVNKETGLWVQLKFDDFDMTIDEFSFDYTIPEYK